jgi:hypothetical protein
MLPATQQSAPLEYGEPESDDDGPDDTRPYLCIPYWESSRFPGDRIDIGKLRPLPAGVISWECAGIRTSAYLPGQELQVTVDVRNSGHGSATVIATVVVYWADPTVGFAKPSFFGVATVAAPTMRDETLPGFVSAKLSSVIPATAPDHICLLARVSHSLDQAQPVADPIGDRHWAQRNLFAVNAKSSPTIVPFVVANPFDTEDLFEMRARTLGRHELELFALREKFEPAEVQFKIQLLDGMGRPLTDRVGEAHAQLTLGPHGRRRYALLIESNQRLASHQLTVLEVVLYQGKDLQRAVGSLGMVVRGDAEL